MNELLKRLEELQQKLQDLSQHLKLPAKRQRLLELEDQMQQPDFWNDNETAQKISQEYNQAKEFCDFWQGLITTVQEMGELVKQNTDESTETLDYLEKQVTELERQYDKNRFVMLLSKKYDDHNAIFSIHAGAGGVDAQDWAEMLLRQYLRYCERKGFKTELIELNKGQDAGIKSATVEVHGQYAYGMLKSEAGVHRLVRLSPFNPAHTRETSFALLELLPLLEEQGPRRRH
jgi:peptide chain release factor 2